MKISIPSSSRRIYQDNKNQFNGNIAESFNLDLTSGRGKIGVTRTKKVADVSASFSTTQLVSNINQSNGLLFYFGAEVGSFGSIYQGGSTAFSSTFVRDSSSAVFSSGSSDLIITNGTAYASGNDSIFYSTITAFGIWTEVSTPALDSSTPHLLSSLGNRVYVSNLDYKIATVDSSNVLSLTGTGTCNFNLPGYTITVLMSGLDRVWVGFSSLQNGQLGTTYIYEWDGESENAPSQRYEIDASGLICGVVKDGIPFVLDTNGRLLRYSGSTFTEVGRLPYKNGEIMNSFNSNQLNQRAIHPRAITVDQDEILINVTNRLQNDSDGNQYYADFPSGVWAWSEENGLYHKLSASYQEVADTGTTNIGDYGQIRVAQAGAIFVHDSQDQLQKTGEGGRIIFSQRYFNSSNDSTDSISVDVSYLTAIFADDTKNNTQKYGYFITRELHTEDIEETWQKLYAKNKKLINSGDKVVVKYRTEMQDKVTGDFEWSNNQTILTSADLSNYSQGDEMQVVQGIGSGKSFTIQSITSTGSGYSVTLTESFAGGVGSGVAQFSNFRYFGEIAYGHPDQYKSFTLPVNNKSPVVQFKVCMQFTGNNELYGIQAISKSNIKE